MPIAILEVDDVLPLRRLARFRERRLSIIGMDEVDVRLREQVGLGVAEDPLPRRVDALEIPVEPGDAQLPGLLVLGSGLGLAFVATSIGALEGVQERDSGLASGLSNTTPSRLVGRSASLSSPRSHSPGPRSSSAEALLRPLP